VTELVIFGAGGHAREVAQLVTDINLAHPGRWKLLGFLAHANATARNAKPLPAPLLGDGTWLLAHPGVQLVIAVGDSAARHLIVQDMRVMAPKLQFATLVHPRAWLAERVTLGQGTVVFAGALVNVDASIGTHASLNLGCTVSHDCVLGNFTNLGPGAHLAGGITVGEGVEIGTGASLRPRVRVGAGVTIGAGAVVVSDLPAHCTAIGVPARSIAV
jgi:sugar O-acyltransferase (sialic acid O-acetyltransferase NeuD family)